MSSHKTALQFIAHMFVFYITVRTWAGQNHFHSVFILSTPFSSVEKAVSSISKSIGEFLTEIPETHIVETVQE